MPIEDPAEAPLVPIVEEPVERAPLTRLDHALLALEVILVASALAGGIPAIIEPSGSLHGLSVDLLEGSAFSDFRLPGLAMVMLFGLLPLVAIVGTVLRKAWVGAAHFEIGLLVVAWSLVQVWLIGWFSWVQPLFLLLGIAVIVLNVKNRFGNRATP